MKKMPVDIDGLLTAPIDFIAYDRAAQKHTMQADLVCPTGERVKFQQGMLFERFQRNILTDRLTSLARRHDRHLFTVAWVAADGRFHPPAGRGWGAIYQRQIDLLDFAQAELVLQPAVSVVIFSQQDQARGLFIEAVHHAWPLFSPDAL